MNRIALITLASVTLAGCASIETDAVVTPRDSATENSTPVETSLTTPEEATTANPLVEEEKPIRMKLGRPSRFDPKDYPLVLDGITHTLRHVPIINARGVQEVSSTGKLLFYRIRAIEVWFTLEGESVGPYQVGDRIDGTDYEIVFIDDGERPGVDLRTIRR